MGASLTRSVRVVCALAVIAALGSGCAATGGGPGSERPADGARYVEVASESYTTTLLVASEIFTTYDRIRESSPEPPGQMPLELFDGMDRKIDGWKKAIEREERRLKGIEPPAGYTIVHEDLLAIDRAMIESLDRLAVVERDRIDGYNLGDLRREVNQAFYDDEEFAFSLVDLLPKVRTTADTLGVSIEDGTMHPQLTEIYDEGGW